MKLKEIQSILEDVKSFSNPKVKLEQYATSPEIAAIMFHEICRHSDDGFEGKSILDLGCGCGMLAIGAKVIGADYVLAVDIDVDALQDCRQNVEDILADESGIDLLQADVASDVFKVDCTFDAVILNPPFGTKSNQGVDIMFLEKAIKLSHQNVYSLHKTSTREFIRRKCKQLNVDMKVVGQFKFDIPKMYRFHKQDHKNVDVDLIKLNVVKKV